jgi:hypothetical protein
MQTIILIAVVTAATTATVLDVLFWYFVIKDILKRK